MSNMNTKRITNVVDAIRQGIAERTLQVSGDHNIVLPVAAVCSKANKLDHIKPADCYLKAPMMELDERNPSDFDLPPDFARCERYKILIPQVTEAHKAENDFYIAMTAWAPFIAPDDNEDMTEHYLTSLGIVMVNFLNRSGSAASQIEKAFEASTYEPVIKPVNMQTFMDVAGTEACMEPHVQEWIALFQGQKGPVLYGFINIVVGFILVLMGKQVSTQVSEQYFHNRYSAFSSRQGHQKASSILKHSNKIPNKTRCAEYYSVISGQFEFRKAAFNFLRRVMKEKSFFLHETLQVVLQYLEFTEMTHIDLIIRHLLRHHKEIISIPCLSQEQEMLDKAFVYMTTKQEQDRPFIKILYPQMETRIMSSQHFYFLAASAKIVASYYSQSYRNYLGGNDEIQKKLKEIIEPYLDASMARGGHDIVGSVHKVCTDEERAALKAEMFSNVSLMQNQISRD